MAPQMAPQTVLQISHLSKKYGSLYAINDLSCEIYAGEIISILGPSGGGKSTLLHLIAGLIQPDAGEIRLQQKLASSVTTMLGPEKRGVNMVFQNYALWPHMNVNEHIVFGLKRRRLTRQQRDTQVNSLLQLLELQGLDNRLPAELSGGQQQRVAIARALATQPRILLLDEPMSNLDGYLRLQMRSQLKALFKELGITVLYVTHDPEEALSMADRLLIIKDGRLEQMDKPYACYTEPATPWVAGLLGAMNRTTSGIAINDQREFHVGEQILQALNPLPDVHIIAGQRVELRSRPEDVYIFEQEPESIPPNYSINQSIVLDSSFEGKYWRITLLNEPDILLYGLHDSFLKPGIRVWAMTDSRKIYAYPIHEEE